MKQFLKKNNNNNQGAEILYEKFIRVYLLRNQDKIDKHISGAAKNAESLLSKNE